MVAIKSKGGDCWQYDQSVVLDGNTLDEDDGNLLDEVVLDGICLDDLVKWCKFDVSTVGIECNDGRVVSMSQGICRFV